MYSDEWRYGEIASIELMEEMPEVTARTNGVGLPTPQVSEKAELT
jgi:hypothetical protein